MAGYGVRERRKKEVSVDRQKTRASLGKLRGTRIFGQLDHFGSDQLENGTSFATRLLAIAGDRVALDFRNGAGEASVGAFRIACLGIQRSVSRRRGQPEVLGFEARTEIVKIGVEA